MQDNAPELDRLLSCDANTFTARLAHLSAEECEQFARAILDRIGGPRFEVYFKRIAEMMIPADGSGPPQQIEAYFHAVRDLFPHIEKGNDRLGRLCAIVVQLCRLHLAGDGSAK